MIRGLVTWAVALSLSLSAWAQAKPGKVDQKAVDEAIKKGAEYLKHSAGVGEGNGDSELVTLTLLHAGMPVNEAPLEDGIKWCKSIDVEKFTAREMVYRIGVASMALWALSAQANQQKLAQFAYFLVANQGPQGEWDYGTCVELPKELKPPDGPGVVVSGGGAPGLEPQKGPITPGKGGTQVAKRIPINPPKRVGADHDYSNTQYAMLGLRACAEAGCVIPEKTWKDCLKNVEAGQFEGGWGYAWAVPDNLAPGTNMVHATNEHPYGSMTCSAICDLVICHHYLGQDWKNSPKIQKGEEWLGKNFTVTEHAGYAANGAKPFPGTGQCFYYYYLYSLERAGALADTDFFGAHDWYQEGATLLLKNQAADGSWPEDERHSQVESTCFAILFLRKATQPIVPRRISK